MKIELEVVVVVEVGVVVVKAGVMDACCGLALESREPASLARRQFGCPQTIFDYEKKNKISFWPHKTAGSLVIILQAGRLLACRQSGFSLQTV